MAGCSDTSKSETVQQEQKMEKVKAEKSAMTMASALRASAELEALGSIEASIVILFGFKRNHGAGVTPMECAFLHIRLASLYKLYTNNYSDERMHLNIALQALDNVGGERSSELRGHLHSWRADLFLDLNKPELAASEIELAIAAFKGVSSAPGLEAYALIKKVRLLLLNDDVPGAIGALLSAIDTEVDLPAASLAQVSSADMLEDARPVALLALASCAVAIADARPAALLAPASDVVLHVAPLHFSPIRTLCRLLSAHLYLRLEQRAKATSALDLAHSEIELADDRSCDFTDSLAQYLSTLRRVAAVASGGSVMLHGSIESLNSATKRLDYRESPPTSISPSSSIDVMLSVFRFGWRVGRADLCIYSSPSISTGVAAFLESFERSSASPFSLEEHSNKQKKVQRDLEDAFLKTVSSRDFNCVHECALYEETTAHQLVKLLLLERQFDLSLASWQLGHAQSIIVDLCGVVDSDAILHVRPQSTRSESLCILECCIAKYLWRLPGYTSEARRRLKMVSETTSSLNTRIGAIVYSAMITLFSEEEDMGTDDGAQAEIYTAVCEAQKPADLLDVSQLLAQAKQEKATTFEPKKVVECDGICLSFWQSTGLRALEAVVVLRRAQEHCVELKTVAAAKQTLVHLTSAILDTGTCDEDLEMAVFVTVALATFSDDVDHSLQLLSKVHLLVKDQSDFWLEKRVLRALERCYLRSASQRLFARASLTIRRKREEQHRVAVGQAITAQAHTAILSWKPKSLANGRKRLRDE